MVTLKSFFLLIVFLYVFTIVLIRNEYMETRPSEEHLIRRKFTEPCDRDCELDENPMNTESTEFDLYTMPRSISKPSPSKSENVISKSGNSFSAFPRLWPSNIAYKEYPSFHTSKEDRTPYEHELPLHIWTNSQSSIRKKDAKCNPYKEWHTKSFPTCNMLHEIDFSTGLVIGNYNSSSENDDDINQSMNDIGGSNEVLVEYISPGKSREAWKLSTRNVSHPSQLYHSYLNFPIVMKTLKIDHVYSEVTYDHQRIDALVTERLTSSPHVANAYGFCGETVLNEYASEGDLQHYFTSTKETKVLSSIQRLIFARDAALGLADIHGIDGDGEITSCVHHDVRAPNFLVVNGKLKFHDFNNARLLSWDFNNDERCEFRFGNFCEHLEEKIGIPPIVQECIEKRKIMTEKAEVYGFGLFLFFLLTEIYLSHQYPFDFTIMREESRLANTSYNMSSLPIPLPRDILESKDPATKAIVHAMVSAFTYESKQRPSASVLAESLVQSVAKIEAKQSIHS